MKYRPVFLILLAVSSAWAGEPGSFEPHAVADKPGADTREYEQSGADQAASTKLPLATEVLLDGSALRSAVVENDVSGGGPGILIVLTDAGKERFAEVTTKYVHKRLGIVLNGQLISAPNVVEPILGGSLRISGNFSVAEAADLVARLNASAAKSTP